MYFLKKITEPLLKFWGPQGQEAIFEVVEAKFWISSIFIEFSFRIFILFGFEVVWPWRPQKGLRDFFQKIHSNEKDEVCHSFLVEIFTKSLPRGGVTSLGRNWPVNPSFLHKFFFQPSLWIYTKICTLGLNVSLLYMYYLIEFFFVFLALLML